MWSFGSASDSSLPEERRVQAAAQYGAPTWLGVLLEMHSEAETEYADLQPDLCGINNRNLGTFHTDVKTSFDLAGRLPKDACRVSESGLKDAATLEALRLAGYRGFLMGERFMKEQEPGKALKEMLL